MRGKEKLNPHAHRAGRWLGWLTVWSDPLHPSSRLLSPGCEFGVCEFGVWMERITPPPKKRLGKTENSIIRPPDADATPPATGKHARHARRREGHQRCAFRRPFHPSARRAAAHGRQQHVPYDSAWTGRPAGREAVRSGCRSHNPRFRKARSARQTTRWTPKVCIKSPIPSVCTARCCARSTTQGTWRTRRRVPVPQSRAYPQSAVPDLGDDACVSR